MSSIPQIAGAILQDNTGRYLLVQEKNEKVYGLWNIPAGYVDTGETPQQAAIRETSEEVGLQVTLISDEPLHEFFNETKQKRYFAFLGKVTGGELQADPREILDVQWKSFADIEVLNSAGKIREPWIVEALRKAAVQ